MHISKFERFCIKHRTLINILLFAVAVFGFSISDSVSVKAAILITVIVLNAFFILVQDRPHITADRLYRNNLDPKSAVNLTEELLKILRKGELHEKQDIYNGLFGYYISIGDYENVIDLCTQIRRENKKLDKSFDLQLRLFLCTAYLNRGEKYLYDKEINEIQSGLLKSKTAKRLLDDEFKEVKLWEEALYGGNDPAFEETVFAFLYKRKANGKIGNKKPSNIQIISAYGLLLSFYKLNGNGEKATEYANKIAEMGNEQLVVYRNAKEYLENANANN